MLLQEICLHHRKGRNHGIAIAKKYGRLWRKQPEPAQASATFALDVFREAIRHGQ